MEKSETRPQKQGNRQRLTPEAVLRPDITHKHDGERREEIEEGEGREGGRDKQKQIKVCVRDGDKLVHARWIQGTW